ncbi:hypothetical protein [Actinopolymorpha alba]|uniref:hypothetical protein n=1 Tax=Actinopolymorpha alba TaxID=533267 RepID=UPI000363A403|nr:hypothetical protein [Actinopolymorpha alba]
MSKGGRDRGTFTWNDPRAMFGLIAIVAFGAFVLYLSTQATAWGDYLSLYAGVAALATGCLGALLGYGLTVSRVQDAKTEMNHAVIERQEAQRKLEGIFDTLADARETLAKVEVVLRETSSLRDARKNDETKYVERLGFDSSLLRQAVGPFKDKLPPEAEMVDSSRIQEVDPHLETLALSADELLDEVRARRRYLRRPD